MNESFDANGFDSFSHAVVLDGSAAKVSELPTVKIDLRNGMAGDAESVYWIGDGFALWCHERITGQQHRMGPDPVVVGSVHVDRGHVMWSAFTAPGDGSSTTSYAAEGCGTARRVDLAGVMVALDWPYVYVRNSTPGWGLRQVNVETGTSATVPIPPVGVMGPEVADETGVFGADGDTLAWTLRRRVFVMDLTTGSTRRLPVQIPLVTGVNGRITTVTVGASSVAVAATGIDGGPDSTWGLLYDVRTGRVTETPGEAWAAGPWTAWLDGDNYVISRQ